MFGFLSFFNDLQLKSLLTIIFHKQLFVLDFLQHFEITMKLHYDGTIIDYLANTIVVKRIKSAMLHCLFYYFRL